MILICKKRKAGLILYKEPIPLEQLLVLDKKDEKQFYLVHLGHAWHSFQCFATQDKLNWIKLAEYHRKAFMDRYRSVQKDYYVRMRREFLSQQTENASFVHSPKESDKLSKTTSKSSKAEAVMETLDEELYPRTILIPASADEKYTSMDLMSSSRGSFMKKFSSLAKLAKKGASASSESISSSSKNLNKLNTSLGSLSGFKKAFDA